MNQEISKANPLWKNYIERWKFLINSYLGGKDYRDGEYLMGYSMEDVGEYESRLDSTPLDNHVKAIVAIYNAFLFRKPPKRMFGSIANDPGLQPFLSDADLDGRDFNTVMRDVSTYCSIYGHSWVIIDKPISQAYTRAEELQQGIRPYVSIYTPENVLDWNYTRAINGVYVLDYLKVYEGNNKGRDTFRIYTPEEIIVMSQGSDDADSVVDFVMANALGRVPAVCVYSQRSHNRGVGVSDVADVADMQRAVYAELSEGEQLLRLTNHPSLVKTASTSAAAGAGAIIQMPEDLQGDLKPYLLQPSGASIDGLLNSLRFKIEAIDRMAHMGGIRSIETRRLSGVALATEFQLLNARLAEKASNLELAEEQIWRLYSLWQGSVWDGVIDYPDTFNIQDRYNDMNMLKLAKDAGPKSDVVNEEIERQMLKILVEDDAKYQQLVDEVSVKSESQEYNETMDELSLIEKVKQLLTQTSNNDTVDMVLGSMAIDEIVEDPILREQISNSYAGRPVNDTVIEQATQEQEQEEDYTNSESCPLPTQDVALNLANRQTAIDTANYGPLNPNRPNQVFWMRLADKWSVSESEARQSLCGNCAAFNQTSAVKGCIEQGLAAGGRTGDEWDTVAAGDLGYCEAFDFKCAANRTCDAWVVGGPITD